jgi:hypothetical protein
MTRDYTCSPYSFYDLGYIMQELKMGNGISPKSYGQSLLNSKRKRR